MKPSVSSKPNRCLIFIGHSSCFPVLPSPLLRCPPLRYRCALACPRRCPTCPVTAPPCPFASHMRCPCTLVNTTANALRNMRTRIMCPNAMSSVPTVCLCNRWRNKEAPKEQKRLIAVALVACGGHFPLAAGTFSRSLLCPHVLRMLDMLLPAMLPRPLPSFAFQRAAHARDVRLTVAVLCFFSVQHMPAN